MKLFESDEINIVYGHSIKTDEQEVQLNFYTDYIVLSLPNFEAMINDIFKQYLLARLEDAAQK